MKLELTITDYRGKRLEAKNAAEAAQIRLAVITALETSMLLRDKTGTRVEVRAAEIADVTADSPI